MTPQKMCFVKIHHMAYFHVNRPEMAKKFLDFREESASQTTTKIVKCWRRKHKKARGKASPSWGPRFASPPTSHGGLLRFAPNPIGGFAPNLGGLRPPNPPPPPLSVHQRPPQHGVVSTRWGGASLWAMSQPQHGFQCCKCACLQAWSQHHEHSLPYLLLCMEPVWVVIYWLGMDGRMLGACTAPCCLLASGAWKFPKGGGISLKVCGNCSMDPAKRFRAFAKKFGN